MAKPTTEARMEYPQLNAAYLAGVAAERKRNERLRKAAQRALDAHRADIRREVELTGEPAEGGAGCWCHDLASVIEGRP